MIKRIAAFSVVVIALVATIFYTNPFGIFGEKIYASVPGNQAPAISLLDLDGKQTDVDFDGSLTVINFWATWCPPCKAEMPEFEQFFQENVGKIAFYAINIKEPQDRVAGFLKASRNTMPVLLDTNGEVAKLYRVNAIPTTLIVDKSGKVVFRKAGAMTKEELDQAISIVK